jgi:hypothetical protein
MIVTKTIVKWVRPAQVVMALVVCMVLLMICQNITYEIGIARVRRVFEARRVQSLATSEPNRMQRDLRDSSREFLFDGTPILAKQTVEPTTGQVRTVRVADPNNRELYNGPPDKNPYTYISWFRQNSRDYQDDTSLGDLVGVYCGLNADFSRMLCVRTVGADQRHSVTWSYDPGLGAFAGYGSEGRFVGYLGANGLTLRRQEVRPLEDGVRMSRLRESDSANPAVLWVAAHAVYLIDFDGMKVTQLFHSDSRVTLSVDINHFGALNTSPYLPGITISVDGVPTAVYLPRSHRLVSIAIPREWSWGFRPAAATHQGLFLRRDTIVGAPSPRDREAYLQWVRQNQDQPTRRIMELMQIQDNGDLKLVSSFEWTRPSGVRVSPDSEQLWDRRIGYVLSVVSPLPTRWVAVRFRYSYYYDGNRYLFNLIQPFARLDVHAPATCAMTLVLMILTFLHARPRRKGWGSLGLWLALVLVFNLAGFLTYLALNHAPVIRCPACGRRRGLSRPDCPDCHSLLPGPQSRPTDLILPVA